MVLLAVGCAGAPRVSGFDDEGPFEDTGTGLVWIVDGAGVHKTLWVSTESGRPLASQPIEGPLWAAGSRLWQWLEEPVGVPLHSCATGAETQHGQAVARRVMVRDLVRSRDIELRAPPELGDVRDLTHVVSPLASVGPFLFVLEELELDGCEASSAEARALVWDLHSGRPTELLSAEERERARARLRAQNDELDEVELVALWPRWEEGRLALSYGFAAEGGAVSTQLDAERLPARLADHARVPVWVRAALTRAPDATLAGFSRVEHPAPARILDTLRR